MAANLERGWAKARLILELAQGEKTQVQLAREYGCDHSGISRFASRHADEIETRRTDLANEWAGLWVTEKRSRMAEYQDDVEAINNALTDEPDEKLLRAKLAIMRQVAEELGQLKDVVQLEGQLTFRVDGIDPAVLR